MNVKINFKNQETEALILDVDTSKFNVVIHQNPSASSIEIADNFSEVGLEAFWEQVKDLEPENIKSIECVQESVNKEIFGINNISYNTIFLENNVEQKIVIGF